MINKVMPPILACLMTFIIVVASTASVYAKANSAYIEKKGYLARFLETEAGNDTGILSSDKEKILNEQGVFDIEIESFNFETIKEIESAEEMLFLRKL